jgi:diketogulonate reductase-like aldo/keto reductase
VVYIPPGCSASLAGQATPGRAESVTEDCISNALKTGYRFFDCAEFYGNQLEIGTALKNSGVPREELYLESKVWREILIQKKNKIKLFIYSRTTFL